MIENEKFVLKVIFIRDSYNDPNVQIEFLLSLSSDKSTFEEWLKSVFGVYQNIIDSFCKRSEKYDASYYRNMSFKDFQVEVGYKETVKSRKVNTLSEEEVINNLKYLLMRFESHFCKVKIGSDDLELVVKKTKVY